MALTRMIRERPLATFFIGSVAIGWVVTALSMQLPSSAVLLPLVAIPVSYVPAAMAVIVTRIGGSAEERRAIRRRLTTFRVGWAWYAVALLALPLIHVAGVGLAALTGAAIPFQPGMIALLPLFLFTNLGEEIGWRGYALPRLQETIDPFKAALIVGFAWALFHWVALLGNAEAPWAYVLVSTAHVTAMSVILTFVFNRARESVPVVALAHASYDTVSIGVVPLVGTGLPLLAFGLSAVVAWLVAAVLVLRWGRELGRTPGGRASEPRGDLTARRHLLGGDMPTDEGRRRSADGAHDRAASDPPDVDWDSPRWRETDDAQGDVERDRRLKGDRAPAQRGAIDESESIDPESSDESE